MSEYPKIPALYRRSADKGHRVLVGQCNDPAVEYLKDNLWFFKEKLDGTNVRIEWDGFEVRFFGRTDRAQLPPPLLEHLDVLYGGGDFEAMFEQTFGEKPVTIYGEGIGPKINKGGDYGDVQFVAFDVLVDETYWLDQGSLEAVLTSMGVPFVPLYFPGPERLSDVVRKINHEGRVISGYKTASPAEGLVATPAYPVRSVRGKRIQVKIKAPELV